MSWIRRLPPFRWLVYGAGAAGLVRAAEASVGEAGAAKEKIDPSIRFEPGDLSPKAVFLTGVGLLAGIWAIVIVLYPLFLYFQYERTGGRDPAKVLVYLPPKPPHPRNEANPHLDLARFKAARQAELNSYRWVDRGKGIVSIPIGRAMQIVAQRGIPPTAPGGKKYFPPRAGTMVTGFEGKVEPIPR